MAENIGLEAVWNNQNFNKGQAEYMKGISQANAATGTGVSGMLALGGAIGLGITAVQGIAHALGSAISGLKDFGMDALEAGSRVQQLSYIAQILGNKQGYSNQQVMDFVDSIRAQGISMQVANEFAAQAIRYNISLADATKLAATAQDAATLAGEGSSEALQGILHGIVTGRPAYLKFHGLLVEAESAFKNYAEAAGIVGRELTAEEKVQATVNAAIEAGIAIQGAYAISMETAGKQLGTLKSRLLPDLIATLGAPFQQAFFNAISGINGMVSGITKLMQEGGALYPIMVNIGAVFALITEPLKNLGTAINEGGGIVEGFGERVLGVANRMFGWGVDMMINLATGIIEGASSAVVGAINWVGSLLASWFSPGSPPKVAPEIDTWGSATMEEYLHGFELADFETLKAVQGPLKTALDAMVTAGDLGKEAGAQLYLDLSQGLAQALASGKLSQGLLDEITAAGGTYGDELAELTQKQFELAKSAEAIALAEKAVEDAKKREQAAGLAVNQGLIEYNQMLRGGASKEQLAAKLKEINANKKAQEQAAKEVTEKEAALELQKEQVKAMQDQVAMLKELISAMADLAKVQKDTIAPTAPAAGGETGGGGGGGGGGAVPALPGGGGGIGDMGSVTDKMKEAINEAMENIKQKVGAAWQNIKNIVKQKWDEAMLAIQNAWNKLIENPIFNKIVTNIQEAWAALGQLWEDIKHVWSHVIQGEWSEAWDAIQTLMTNWWENYKTMVGNYLELVALVISEKTEKIKEDWALKWEEIKVKAGEVWDSIKEKVSAVFSDIKQWLEGQLDALFSAMGLDLDDMRQKWTDIWNDVVLIVETVWGRIKTSVETKVQELKTAIQGPIDEVKTWWETTWGDIETTIGTVWTNIQTSIGSKLTEIITDITDFLTGPEGIVTKITNAADDIFLAGKDFISGLRDGILQRIGEVIQEITGAVQGVIDAIMALLQIEHSPSELTKKWGKELMQGLGMGVEANINLPGRSMQKAAMNTLAAIPITMGATNYYQPNINMHTTINGGIGVAQMESMVVRAVKRGLTK